MKPTSLISLLALALALSACTAPQPRYQPTPRPTIPALPPDLATKEDPATLCRKLLLTFSASEQALLESCGIKMP